MKRIFVAYTNLKQFMLYVAIMLGSFLFEGCCGSGDGDSGYTHSYKYASALVLTDKSDLITAIHYDALTDTLHPNNYWAPLAVSLRIDTWLWVKTLKHEYRLCLSSPNTMEYNYDKVCGSTTEMKFESIKVLHSENGTATVNTFTLYDNRYYNISTTWVDSVYLTP